MLSSIGRVVTSSFRNRPIFVVGAGRSGTTVVQEALGKHPAIISSPSEAPFVCAIGSAARSLVHGDTVDYRVRTLRTSVGYTNDALRRIAFESAMGLHFGLIRVLRQLLEARKIPFAVRRWCTKTFPGPEVADGLTTLYPDVRFVYVVRNGCDVVRSRTRFHAMRDRTFRENCREWAESVERYGYLLTDSRALAVRHEDLTDDPDGTFDSLLDFLGEARHPAPATFVKTTLVHPLDQATEVDVAVRDRLGERTPSYEAWSDDERNMFKALCGDAMSKLGYGMPF